MPSMEMATKRNILLILNMSCYILLIISLSYSDTDTILQGQQLMDWDHLNSANNIFRLQFFSPASTKNRYLGIFYNIPDNGSFHNSDREAVWVANRDNPIPDASGILMIDVNGTLKISYGIGGANHINLTTSVPTTTSINTSLALLDSGNLVLRELLNSDGSAGQVLWQSFDYPSDVLLPGMKLGVNFKTGHKWSLTSWISTEIPASGSFTFGGDPNGTSQLIIWWRGDIYWTSGIWHNGRFEFAPRLSDRHLANFSYVSNEDEKYLIYAVPENNKFPRYTMDPDGAFVERFGGIPFGLCYLESRAFTANAGCVEKKLPECRNNNYRFHPRQGFIYGDGFKFDETYNLSLVDCRAKCLNNCSCMAFASANDNGTGCEIWGRGMTFRPREIDGRVVYLLAPQKAKKWWIWLITSAGALVILSSCYLIQRKLRVKRKIRRAQKMLLDELEGNTKPSTKNSKSNNHKDRKMSHDLHLFSFESIAAATSNFSITNKLGQGGFGPVYKGKLLDGQEIAIKRLSRSSGQGLVEFKNEIVVIAKLQHNNLVRILGCCIQGEEKILVYEYMPNKSLDFFLFDPNRKKMLKWTNRLNIIEGIAQGLLYLHKYSRLRVIHRDLKASNVLLDGNMNPKISDFGMARIFGLNESEANTNRVVGTYGYMSPEYAMNGIVSMKTDVFSFGVLLIEIVSGKKNNSCSHSEHPLNLIGYAWELWKEGRALELMDPTLDGCPASEVNRCIHVGLLCVQDHAVDRPSMSDVISMLTNETMHLAAPKQRAFFIESGGQEVEKDKLENCSVNKLSISVMEAR